MRRAKGGPPGEPGAGNKVISIVDQLQKKQLVRDREESESMHLRELERSTEASEALDAILGLTEAEYEAELARISRLPDKERALEAWAGTRSTRAYANCVRGNVDEGLAEWAEVIAEAPDHVGTRLLRARWLMRSDPAAALEDYDRAAALEPKNSQIYRNRGDCLQSLGDPERALANYLRAVALDPTDIDAYHAMAQIHSRRGENAEAARAWDRAIQHGPKYVDYYFGRGHARESLGDSEGAMKDFAKVFELDPSRHDARTYLALSLRRLDQLPRAIEELERVAELAPDDHKNLRMLGQFLLEDERLDEAIEVLGRSAKMRPDSRTSRLRGWAHYRADRVKEAHRDFEEAVALDPGDPENYLCRAKSHAALGRHKWALMDASQAVTLDPEHAFAHFYRASLRDEMQQDRALVDADYDKAVDLAPDNATILCGRGEYRFEIGRHTDAAADYTRAIALEPAKGEHYLARGRCLSHQDQPEDGPPVRSEDEETARARHLAAVADFEKALEVGYQHQEVYSELYQTAKLLHDPEAERWLDRGIAALPGSGMLHAMRETSRHFRGDVEGSLADRARSVELGFRDR